MSDDRPGLLARVFSRGKPVIPVVRLSGTIGMPGPLRQTLTIDTAAKTLDAAFGIKSAPAVTLVINSPGGSPVQSHLIYRRIRLLAEEKRKPVIAFLEDVAASGGYMIACAADEIISDPHTIVGSIGVVSAGFGFPALLERIGVERRVYTSGRSKSQLDPFRPEKPEDVARLKSLQEEVHGSFIDLVKNRRPRLADDPDLFTGAFWTGMKGVELGLVDGIGELRATLHQRFGKDTPIRVLGERRGFLRRRLGIPSAGAAAPSLAAASVDAIMATLEDRALWGRFGL